MELCKKYFGIVLLVVCSVLLANVALASNGQGLGPESVNSKGGDGLTFCQLFPWACQSPNGGGNGSGNEPPN